jgi:hypothetical protein
MTRDVSDPVAIGLLRQLEHNDLEALNAWETYRRAWDEYVLAALKYAAIRDVATERAGASPYAEEIIGPGGEQFNLPSKGRFRFYNMSPVDAAMQVLDETNKPMTLDELVTRLRAGGIGTEKTSLARSVNASLVNKSEIEYSKEDGTFRLKREDPLDSIPF